MEAPHLVFLFLLVKEAGVFGILTRWLLKDVLMDCVLLHHVDDLEEVSYVECLQNLP